MTPWSSPGQNTGVGSFSLLQGSCQTRNWTQVTCIAGRFFTSWATREARSFLKLLPNLWMRPWEPPSSLGECLHFTQVLAAFSRSVTQGSHSYFVSFISEKDSWTWGLGWGWIDDLRVLGQVCLLPSKFWHWFLDSWCGPSCLKCDMVYASWFSALGLRCWFRSNRKYPAQLSVILPFLSVQFCLSCLFRTYPISK